MPTKRTQRRYDHRIVELVRSTGDITVATTLGIPRSTAAGWLRQTRASDVVTAPGAEGLDDLRRRLAVLEGRVQQLAAILRIVFTLFRILHVDLARVRIAGEEKRKLLGVIERTKGALGLRRVLRLFGLSPSRFHAWRQETMICAFDGEATCARSSPQRLTPKEVFEIGEMVKSTEFRHVPTARLALWAQRTGRVFASAATWSKLIRQRGWRRPRGRVHPEQPKTGIRASKPDEIWHIDTTIIRLLDGTKVYLHAAIDNFSRRILAWKVAATFSMANTAAILGAAAQIRSRNDRKPERTTVLADSGVENVNGDVDRFIRSGAFRRLIAQVEIRFSNSMIEAFWRSLKHQWLFLNELDTLSKVSELVAFYVDEHNSKLPHSAFRGQTPDEMYFGTGDGVPKVLEEKRRLARQARLEENRARRCEACGLNGNGGTDAA